jgi:PadR family transcriptional regulator PadR
MVDGDAGKLLAQIRRGTIEYCVLALLSDRDRYGFELIRTLSDNGMVTSEGTVYPLLTRLRNDGHVETFWQESPQGPPRRYYRLTDAGRLALESFVFQWKTFKDTVDSLLEGGTLC